IYVAQLAGSDGSAQWARSVGSSYSQGTNDEVDDVAVDSAGNIDIGGSMRGPTDFGAGVVAAANTRRAALRAQYSPARAYRRAKEYGIGTGGDDIVRGIAVDSANNVIAGGLYQHTVNFGGPSLTAVDGDAAEWDAFVLKLNGANGATLVARSLGGLNHQEA